MRLLQRLRDWFRRFLARRQVRGDAKVLDSKIRGVLARVLEFQRLYGKIYDELEDIRLQCDKLRGEAAELERTQDQLLRENQGLREVRKYYDELLIPAMTQGHSKVMALLEAETAIQIKRQVAARTVE